MKTKTVTAAEYLIWKLGGLTKTANAYGVAISTVQGWKERGNIPSEHWPRLIELARDAGLQFTFEDFFRRHKMPASAREAA